MKTKFYHQPQCEVFEVDQHEVLCTSLEPGAEKESFDEFGILEMN